MDSHWDIAMMVTEDISGAHPKIVKYQLLPGDLLSRESSGTWKKFAPGIMIGGFNLSPEQEETLKVVRWRGSHLLYEVHPEDVL